MPDLAIAAPEPQASAPEPIPGLIPAGIAGIGAAVPDRVVGTAEIGERVGVDEDWIVSRTGVRNRHVIGPGESLVELAGVAAAEALAAGGVEAAALDTILFATFTPDALQPHSAPDLAARLGGSGATAIDVGAACSGFVAALAIAAGQIESGRARTVLVVGADAMSRILDHDDAKTAGLFGDGAGAAVVTAGGPGSIGPVVQGSDASGVQALTASNTERLLRMDGRPTFRAAVATLERTTREAAALRGLDLDEIDLFVYHQANARILAAVGERLALPAERIVDCIGSYGNTSAASIPIALTQAAAANRLRPGSKVLLGAFGAGFTWATTVLDWEGSA